MLWVSTCRSVSEDVARDTWDNTYGNTSCRSLHSETQTDWFVSKFQVLLHIWYNSPVSYRTPGVSMHSHRTHGGSDSKAEAELHMFQDSRWHITFTWRVDWMGYCRVQVYLLAHWFSATRHRPICWEATLSLTMTGKCWYLHCQVSSVTVSGCRYLHLHSNSMASSHIRCCHPRQVNMLSYYPSESLRVVMWSCHEDHHSTDNWLWWHIYMHDTSYINKYWDKWTPISQFKGGMVSV